ncbi:unnamed protein product [Phytophthora fragariaefolia]|uniref:RxLR effector protein n=1 Tax=Phytophthora fragariaefolia TaxID=1490495 RepID=A0A9W6XJB9_9STRA|nr:unnamed protein product [Phytophthora fragariaefolia]
MADSIDHELTSQFSSKLPSLEEQAIMQYGLFMVLAAACFFASCDLAVGSIDKDTMVPKEDAMTSINDHLVYRNGDRLLRNAAGDNGRYEKLEGEDRANGFLDWVKSLLKAKKAVPDLKRTFPSPPVVDKLVRSQSLPSKKGGTHGKNVEAFRIC